MTAFYLVEIEVSFVCPREVELQMGCIRNALEERLRFAARLGQGIFDSELSHCGLVF